MRVPRRDMLMATIVGARPQFIKAAVVSREIRRRLGGQEATDLDEHLIHTGQHFDRGMSKVFFEEMAIPAPAVHLGISGGPHGRMTGRMLEAIEAELIALQPAWVLVYGDTNSTLAGALAAAKLNIPLAHVEAGLRSFNRRMPEELNRILTDHAASLLFAPTKTAVANLRREGVDEDRIVLSGDVMFDAMLFYREAAAGSDVLARVGVEPGRFVLATVHRAENTDDRSRLAGIMEGLGRLARDLDVVLPLHPRTRQALAALTVGADRWRAVRLIDPVGYLDMVRLESCAALVATDSGGVQKEAFFNRVPCITLRDETEWVELLDAGANTLCGTDPDRIAAAGRAAIGTTIADAPLFGDGHAARVVVDRLLAVPSPSPGSLPPEPPVRETGAAAPIRG